MDSLDPDAVDPYLTRIGLDPATIRAADRDRETVRRLQTAHVRRVPFENLAIVGDPFGEASGRGVTLDIPHLYRKIVEDGRGGYCFVLNGLFASLLTALGFEVSRIAAMVISDSDARPTPANHHSILVSLEQPVIVDVGMGAPQMRRPVPLTGSEIAEEETTVRWRVTDTSRPQYDRRTEFKLGEDNWQRRYVFDTTPRELSYFQASCDYLSAAPESMFTDSAVVRIATADGWLELDEDTFVTVSEGDRSDRKISPADWYRLLEQEFGLTVPPA